MEVLDPRPGDARVRVDVGVDSRGSGSPPPTGLCLLAVLPPMAGRLSARFPRSRVKDTRFGDREGRVEHLRFTAVQDFSALPGLHPVLPSRLRDAVILALGAGAQSVDLLAVQARKRAPWMFDDGEVLDLLSPFLDELHGAVLAIPDLGGPWELGRAVLDDLPTRRSRLLRTMEAMGPGLAERFQTLLFDLPPEELTPAPELLSALGGVDAAACCWSGAPERLRAHGWRSAAAAVGGLIAREPFNLLKPLSGEAIRLGPGRSVRPDKGVALGRAPQGVVVPPDRRSWAIQLAVARFQDEAVVRSEPSLRAPHGAWPLPALRTVKAIHKAILDAANPFVFRPLVESEAFGLVLALNEVVRPLSRRGILTGPAGEGAPLIDAELDRDPASPGFVAVMAAQLRPWAASVHIRVRVRPGAQPTLEGA